MRDLLFQRAQAQGAVEAARNGDLAGRAGPQGQADQAGISATVAGFGDGGLETLTGPHRRHIHGVRQGGGDGRSLLGGDAGATHGLLEGFATTDLDRNSLRQGQAGRHPAGGKGLGFKRSDLGGGQGRSLFRLCGLVDTAGKQRHRDCSHRRKGVRRNAHRLATWVELSHRSPKYDDAERRQATGSHQESKDRAALPPEEPPDARRAL